MIKTCKESGSAWKGGITPINLAIRGCRKYNQWREQIFARDVYTCQKCGRVNSYLHAHHKKRFSVILNDIKQQYPLLSVIDVAEQYPTLWDIKNGITLCKSCHKQIHKEKILI